MKYIDIANIGFKYESEPVLENISFQVSAGEFIILTGENGAAKSTLLRIILGILQPGKGSVTFTKKNADGGRLLIGYVPQQIASFNAGFPSTVLELVRSGRFPNGKWFKRLTKKDHAHVEKALKSVEMWDYRHKRIGELSGGQKQRICLARMFATDPDILILDEPQTAMDKQSKIRFYDLLKHEAQVHNKAILMVTHDSEEMETYVDKHIRLVRKEDVSWKCFSMDLCKEPSKPQ
ncbi:metal ABC transporter ATP-binding protein [Listeria welshimeri]|uniref:Metal ABC transporter ATP-binding protein n=1 Tax=Listeria welshimeri TaxID=1643 RepID=A0A7X0W623_LISWE|nr:metal ABC transporter ATP-binding protein [Listeria welshimeri]MBC1324255.1 metal ABC transporter ATP-binding protein [Listeria welshimeri]MBC1432353.1 metal ABC transporter ATP-binding protein [Listeria welshimeri]MBC1614141.1 metal ABC transporter ATP-binding protein [Listeria welshimeri]MBC1631613.1 metal ABC transporter ATP-binding protein [Listeria welshimeri]MBC1670417.1 metal ABC transporter ATP-binding protein [Listeria welshimeri]